MVPKGNKNDPELVWTQPEMKYRSTAPVKPPNPIMQIFVKVSIVVIKIVVRKIYQADQGQLPEVVLL